MCTVWSWKPHKLVCCPTQFPWDHLKLLPFLDLPTVFLPLSICSLSHFSFLTSPWSPFVWLCAHLLSLADVGVTFFSFFLFFYFVLVYSNTKIVSEHGNNGSAARLINNRGIMALFWFNLQAFLDVKFNVHSLLCGMVEKMLRICVLHICGVTVHKFPPNVPLPPGGWWRGRGVG